MQNRHAQLKVPLTPETQLLYHLNQEITFSGYVHKSAKLSIKKLGKEIYHLKWFMQTKAVAHR